MWNGQDDRLKERYFGLTNGEGNHGEDAKEYWWHLDATPTHSWAQYLYRYPQAAFPYAVLREESAARGHDVPEFQLVDTGVLDEDRFFDVVHDPRQGGARATSASPSRRRTTGRTRRRSTSCRSSGSATPGRGAATTARRSSRSLADAPGARVVLRADPRAHRRRPPPRRGLPRGARLRQRDPRRGGVRRGREPQRPPQGRRRPRRRARRPQPARHRRARHQGGAAPPLRRGRARARRCGSGCACTTTPGPTGSLRTTPRRPGGRLRRRASTRCWRPAGPRRTRSTPPSSPSDVGDEERHVARRAFAGLNWCKQLYRYDVREWLEGDPAGTAAAGLAAGP